MAKFQAILVVVALVVVIVGILAQTTGFDKASSAALESMARFGEPCYQLTEGGS